MSVSNPVSRSTVPACRALDAVSDAVRIPKFERFFIDLSTDHLAYIEHVRVREKLPSGSSALRVILERAMKEALG